MLAEHMNGEMVAIESHGSIDRKLASDIASYLKSHEAANVYLIPDFCDIIRLSFCHEYVYLIARQRGNIVGLVPFVFQFSRLFGRLMTSMPYFNYGGILADDDDVVAALLESARQIGKDRNIDRIEVRETVNRKDLYDCVELKKISMILMLNDKEDLWKSLGSKRRAQIKRPMRLSPTVQHGGLELLEDFYSVFSRNMRDLGTPVYTKEFFKNILECKGIQAHITIVRLDNKPVACGFVIGFQKSAEIPWASSLREYNNVSINMYLYWEVISKVIEMGYEVFDFGRCSRGSGTYKFKKQWGAKEIQLYWGYVNQGQDKIDDISPENKKYKIAISLWKNLPLPVTNYIGPKIARFLP